MNILIYYDYLERNCFPHLCINLKGLHNQSENPCKSDSKLPSTKLIERIWKAASTIIHGPSHLTKLFIFSLVSILFKCHCLRKCVLFFHLLHDGMHIVILIHGYTIDSKCRVLSSKSLLSPQMLFSIFLIAMLHLTSNRFLSVSELVISVYYHFGSLFLSFYLFSIWSTEHTHTTLPLTKLHSQRCLKMGLNPKHPILLFSKDAV